MQSVGNSALSSGTTYISATRLHNIMVSGLDIIRSWDNAQEKNGVESAEDSVAAVDVDGDAENP